jgi:hypothetical protein
MSYANITDLYGKTLTSIVDSDADFALVFYCYDGTTYKMYHDQECCESVHLEDIVGDLDDLIGSPILTAEERSDCSEDKYGDRIEWTFYELATVKGSVTLRWYGTSNGYYSTSVDFKKLT